MRVRACAGERHCDLLLLPAGGGGGGSAGRAVTAGGARLPPAAPRGLSQRCRASEGMDGALEAEVSARSRGEAMVTLQESEGVIACDLMVRFF